MANPELALTVGVITLAVLIIFYGPEAHNVALRADLQIAGILGRDRFLSTLGKIDGMGFSDVERLKRKSSKYKQPSISERIHNLQSSAITVVNS